MIRSTVMTIASVVLGLALVSPALAEDLKVGTWSGTSTRVNAGGNRQTRPAFLEVKIVPDPHWQWRGGAKDLLNASFGVQQQRSELSAVRFEGGVLFFAFTQPEQDQRVQCDLKRQTDGTYEGDCRGGPQFHLVLTPPPDAPEPATAKPPAP